MEPNLRNKATKSLKSKRKLTKLQEALKWNATYLCVQREMKAFLLVPSFLIKNMDTNGNNEAIKLQTWMWHLRRKAKQVLRAKLSLSSCVQTTWSVTASLGLSWLEPHLQITPNPAGSPHSVSQIPTADRHRGLITGMEKRKKRKQE